MQVLMMMKRNSLDKDCHHKKGEECECMNTLILMLPKSVCVCVCVFDKTLLYLFIVSFETTSENRAVK